MKNKFLFLLLLLCMAGCRHQPANYHYLMLHPSFLQKEMSRCQVEVIESSGCNEVKRAAQDFDLLITERETNPEQFGEKVLRAEEHLAQSLPSDPTYQSQVENLQILMAVLAETNQRW